MQTTSGGRRLDAGFIIGILVVGAAASLLGEHQPKLAVVLVLAVAFLGFLATRPVLAAVAAVPAVYGFQSVGLGGGLGVSDVLLVVTMFLALPAIAHSPEMQSLTTLNRSFALYALLLVPSLLVNQTGAADREVLHRFILVSGAAVVGAWLVYEHAETAALKSLLVVSTVLAVVAGLTALTNGFRPAEPFGYNKNYLGSLLALTLVIMLCAPEHLAVSTSVRVPAIALLIAGTVACQSRGAILGAGAGGLLWLFAPRQGTGVAGRNRVVALLLAASFVGYSGYSVQQQFTSANKKTNSAGVRLDVEAYTRDLWRTSPVVGIGIRYFNTGNYGFLGINPNNAIDAELAESGLVGTAGFVAFHVAILLALWRRRRSQLGIAALAVVVGQLLHGQFDNYWSSGITPLPFIIAGMALAGAAQREASA